MRYTIPGKDLKNVPQGAWATANTRAVTRGMKVERKRIIIAKSLELMRGDEDVK